MSIRRGYIELPADYAGAQLHYRRAGRLGAPTLLMLHQTPSSSAMYEPLMQVLADDFDMLALDTPGFGGSDGLPGDFSVAATARALGLGLEQLHIGPCYVFGHHTGAALALQLAHDSPQQVAALAMSGPCLLDEGLREKLRPMTQQVTVQHDGAHLQDLWTRMRGKDSAVDPAIWQRETLIAAAVGNAYPQAYAAVLEVDTAVQLQALTCPTLVFSGTQDPLFSQLEASFRLLQKGQKAEISGARSYVCESHCDQVATLLKEFFGAQHG
ncbi:MAG: alpha/beta fold hydrolase [Oceanococcus sp.]